MTRHSLISTRARLSGIPFDQLAKTLLNAARDFDLDAARQPSGAVRCNTPVGAFRFAPDPKNSDIVLRLHAARPDHLYMLKEGVVEHLAAHLPKVAATLQWQGDNRTGQVPPNLRLVRVQSVTPVGTKFLRVRVTGEGLQAFASGPLHFRLVLPQPGDTAPHWPMLDASGRTQWPEGDKALHRPVYTIRQIDPDRGILDFDVFLHDGGRVTEWARQVTAGAQVGLMGPNGGGLLSARQLLIAGDETAFPAIARILEAAGGDAQGRVTLLSDGVPDYPMPRPPGVRFTHLDRADGDDPLGDHLRGWQVPEGDYHLWIACDTPRARALRSHFREGLGVPKERSYIAGFWDG